MMKPEQVLAFWLDECSPSEWYTQSDALDQKIRDQFEPAWHDATRGAFGLWLTYPTGALAYLILTDQFPRNMFRKSALAFRSDRMALAAAKKAIHQGWDMRTDTPARQFFYLPLMHSECLPDQDRCVRLVRDRLDSAETLLHARVHREIIRTYGRFPYRNAALGRKNTPAEEEFLVGAGYSDVLKRLQRTAENA
ncbi:MAG: DUF924 family protein [Pseudomonadota bacterium]